jgi:hypothetical protein
MKHLSWVLLTVFCSAVLQVQPAATTTGATPPVCCTHCHCQVPGDCGMPCSPCAAPAEQVLAAQGQGCTALPAAQVSKVAKPPAVKFYASCIDEPAAKAKLPRTAKVVRAAVEPLFMVQCRILI